jgi:hypothetical protein
MVMKNGERWHCTNAACRCSILVETTGEAEGKNPLCTCGNVMKKQYAPPVFQYLDFLRFPEPAAALHQSPED